MADNVAVTAGSGTTIAADEVIDGTLGTVKVGYVKLMDGTLDGTSKAAVGANGLACDVKAVAGNVTVINAGTFAVQSAQSGTWTVGHGKTIKMATGSTSSSGDNTVVSAVSSKRIKVIAFSLITASTTAVTGTFKDNTAGTAVATYPLQAIASTNFGITQATSAPSFLFASTAGNPLVLNLSAAQSVTYSITYFDDDAS